MIASESPISWSSFIDRSSPLWPIFRSHLENVVEEIEEVTNKKYVLKRMDKEKHGKSFYYAHREGKIPELLTYVFPKIFSPFRVSGTHNVNTGDVTISTIADEKYRDLIRKHVQDFLDETSAERYGIDV